jgi:hypothetical protein
MPELDVGNLDGRVEQRVKIDRLALAIVGTAEANEVAHDSTHTLGAFLRAAKQLAYAGARARDRDGIVAGQLPHAHLVVELVGKEPEVADHP